MTKAELRTVVKQALGNRTSSTLTSAWYDNRVLDGYRRLVTYKGVDQGPGRQQPSSRVLRFHGLDDRKARNLSTGDNGFASNASDVAVVRDVYDRTNNRPLTLILERDLLARDPDTVGVPTHFALGGYQGKEGYYYWPKLGSTAHIISVYEYVTLKPTLASDSSEPVVPGEWHTAIAWAAISQGALLLDMPEKQQEYEQRFMQEIATRQTPTEVQNLSGKGSRRINIGIWRR